ncbi:hypothetical protein ILUMI_13562 [Ignelater luminosus]|uniref:C-type lectin domain-containing protein n=1 Tax=Ignelater luminosus TaxID=2038154 RepID=A0A8K0CVZ8_IGNLU|nr:hypothetical protein ILUMI_13562 [Ignelater luminosus]
MNGRLAHIPNEKVADFIAEALSETILINSSVWIAAKTKDSTSGELYWFDENNMLEPLSEALKQLIDNRIISHKNDRLAWSESEEVLAKEQHKLIRIPYRFQKARNGDGLSIDRIYFDIPRLFPDKRTVLKPILCERQANKPKIKPSQVKTTHKGWIKIKNRYFKIFLDSLTWDEAQIQCNKKNATLATLTEQIHVQSLGRYLLIGRPTLRNAWIGARFIERNFLLVETNKTLSDSSDESFFPSWRNGHVQRKRGCVMLDRSVAVESVFIETNCLRKRAFICSRADKGNEEDVDVIVDNIDKEHKIDVEIDSFGYRVFYQKFSWTSARDKCNTYKEKYGGKLVEINNTINFHLLHIMGESKVILKDIWVGGKYENETWIWDSNNAEIYINGTSLKNEYIDKDIERENRCLNMGRENFNESIYYGTLCAWGQSFVCLFEANRLKELGKDEEENKKTK